MGEQGSGGKSVRKIARVVEDKQAGLHGVSLLGNSAELGYGSRARQEIERKRGRSCVRKQGAANAVGEGVNANIATDEEHRRRRKAVAMPAAACGQTDSEIEGEPSLARVEAAEQEGEASGIEECRMLIFDFVPLRGLLHERRGLRGIGGGCQGALTTRPKTLLDRWSIIYANGRHIKSASFWYFKLQQRFFESRKLGEKSVQLHFSCFPCLLYGLEKGSTCISEIEF